jgi:NAD-dependent deacetylase
VKVTMNHSAVIAIPQDLICALQTAKHIVVFTGAGVSAESGIPTFRDALTGLWERFDATDLATPDAFRKDEELVWGWYEWRRMRVLRAQPNPAHLAIAALAQHVAKLTVVTQNVDDLHERAGSADVLHLHGSLHCPRCYRCGQAHILPPCIPDEPDGGRRLSPPSCHYCGGSVRPGVVWFGEALPEGALDRAFGAARDCDLLFAIGTSGLVQPAAGIPSLARQAGAMVVQVNPMGTQLDSVCTWSLREAAGAIMPRLLQAAFPSAPQAHELARPD